MENEKTGENIAERLEDRIDQLANSIQTISSELATIKINVQKRKHENATLKILFYTGVVMLFLGVLYTNSTLQRAQMDSLESSIHTLQTLMSRELISVEKNIYGQIDRFEKSAGERSEISLRERLENMTLAISQLDPGDGRMAGLIEQVKRDSMELSRAYEESGRKSSEDEDGPGGADNAR